MRIPRSVFDATRLSQAISLGLVACALLAGCTPADDATPAQATATPAPADAAPAPMDATTPDTAAPAATGATTGGDGSEIQLDALTESDLAGATLAGELACSFSLDGAQPLLLAKGDVASDAPAQGVVKVAGYVEPVRAPGGFDGMTKDPTFSGQGKTLRIVETGAPIGGGESPARPATLTYQRADGASRTFDGRWQCGP
ncbi:MULTISPECIES: hypothetical protein [Luteimonas]|uniref:hypothetical protein n=1 Tax=Luteimonas TaxID=83614 RepID=UPI000C7C9967|nr:MULTISPECIES: hypothetical protein [Luteimonas]